MHALHHLTLVMVLTLMLACCACGTPRCNPPDSTLVSISPTSATVGIGFILTATGTNFGSSAVLLWDGVSQPTTVVNSTTLTATISASTSTGSHNVQVDSGQPFRQISPFEFCGGPSNILKFTVTPLLKSKSAPVGRHQSVRLLCWQFQ